MTDQDIINAEFDEKIEIDQSCCCFCKIGLTEANKSGYRMFAERDGKPCIGALCLNCREVFERLNKIKDGIMQNSEVEIKVRQQIYAEGWTNEMLRAGEEREFATIN